MLTQHMRNVISTPGGATYNTFVLHSVSDGRDGKCFCKRQVLDQWAHCHDYRRRSRHRAGSGDVLAERGADIVLAGRRLAPLESTAGEIEALGRRAIIIPTDVTDADQCRALIDTTIAEFGRLDVLMNNAGGGETKPLMKWTDDEWHAVLDLNLSSAWYLSRAAVKPMIEQKKGAIVNISSGAGLLAMPQAPIYGAAKAGLQI